MCVCVCAHAHVSKSNLANTASLLWHAYHSLSSPSNAVNWAGTPSPAFPVPPSPIYTL